MLQWLETVNGICHKRAQEIPRSRKIRLVLSIFRTKIILILAYFHL